MEVKGIITWVGTVQSGDTERGHWERQDIVVEYGSIAYSRKIMMTLGTEKIKVIQPHIGMKGTFSFEVDAHEYKGRWFNGINCWKFEPLSNNAPATENAPQGNANDDDLAF